MRNVLNTSVRMHKKFDLKGSTVDRSASDKEKVHNLYIGQNVSLSKTYPCCLYAYSNHIENAVDLPNNSKQS